MLADVCAQILFLVLIPPLRSALEWIENSFDSIGQVDNGAYILSTLPDPSQLAAPAPVLATILGPIDCSEPTCLGSRTAAQDLAKLKRLGGATHACRPIVVELATMENFGDRNPCRDYVQRTTGKLFIEAEAFARCAGGELVLLANGTCADWSLLVNGGDRAGMRDDCERRPEGRPALFARFVRDQVCGQRVFRSGARYFDLAPGSNVSAAIAAAVSGGGFEAAGGGVWVSCVPP